MRRLAVLACLGLACTLRGDGERVVEVRELASFSVIELFDGFVTTVVVDPTLDAKDPVALSVSADGNAMRRIFTELHGEGTLSVAVDPNNLTRLSLTPEIEVTVPALRRAYAADTTVLEVLGAQGELSLEALGSATVDVAGAGVMLTATAREDATLILTGDGPTLILEVYDAATVDARSFHAGEVVVYARGVGEVRVCASERLTIRGVGAGLVTRACN
jgi:hypothetical protein